MLQLRPFTREDFSRIIHWIDSPHLLVQWAGPELFTYPLDEAQLEKYLRHSEGENARSLIFKAVSTETQETLGHIELAGIGGENHVGSICRVYVDTNFRGRGICPEMVRKLLEIGFSQLGLHRIDLRVYEFSLDHRMIHWQIYGM